MTTTPSPSPNPGGACPLPARQGRTSFPDVIPFNFQAPEETKPRKGWVTLFLMQGEAEW